MSTPEAFFEAPSEALLLAFTKDQLNCVAEHYSIDLTLQKGAKKDELFSHVHACLIDKKVLPESQEHNGDEELVFDKSKPGSGVSSASVSGLSYEQQVELMKLQHAMKMEVMEKELAVKRIEAQNKEKDRELEMERTKLQLAAGGRFGSASVQSGLATMMKFLP